MKILLKEGIICSNQKDWVCINIFAKKVANFSFPRWNTASNTKILPQIKLFYTNNSPFQHHFTPKRGGGLTSVLIEIGSTPIKTCDNIINCLKTVSTNSQVEPKSFFLLVKFLYKFTHCHSFNFMINVFSEK